MKLLTTNGMDVKGMKGYTNPSKQDVTRYPSDFGRVFPTGRVYQFCPFFYTHTQIRKVNPNLKLQASIIQYVDSL